MNRIGFVITHSDPKYTEVRFRVRLAYVTQIRNIRIDQYINPTHSFLTYTAAKNYARRYFMHLKRTTPWIYVDDLTDVGHIDYIYNVGKYVGDPRRYKDGKKYFTLAKKTRSIPRKFKRKI